jgi:glycosyltransferase involved in cell wall biosynthesis
MNQSATSVNSSNENVVQMQKEVKATGLGVCFLITDIDTSTGGVQSISLRLMNELNKQGVKTFVCARNYLNRQRDEQINGTQVFRSPIFKRFSAVLNSVSYLFYGLLWLIRRRKQYDVIHCQQIFAPAMLGLLARKILRKPVLVGVHRSGDSGEVTNLRKTPFRNIRIRQMQNADCWTVLSEEMREELESIGIAPEKIRFIPNSVVIPSETAYAPGIKKAYRAKLELPYEQIVVFSGRLSAEKNLDVLVKSWAKVYLQNPQAHLLILGKGGGFPDAESEVKALCSELNLDNTIHFLGFKSNPMEYLLAADVFVLPTSTEGMSVALIEAMAAGTAIITTDISANQYLCQNEVNSLLVAPGDIDRLAESLTRILNKPKLQERLGRAAREKACQDLSVEIMTNRYLGLYSSLIKKFEDSARK